MAFFKAKKNKLWIWKAYCRNTGKLIDWECGARDTKTFNKMLQRLKKWNVKIYFTDNWKSYAEVIPKKFLIQSKKETNAIERNNSRQRHWFARFRRKTCVISRSLQMVDLTVSLFAKFHVNGSFNEVTLFS